MTETLSAVSPRARCVLSSRSRCWRPAPRVGRGRRPRHRARLSRDLAERLVRQRVEASSVIVCGRRRADRSARGAHGARVKKRLHGGAVLEVAGGALDAISQDPETAHLSGDVPVHRMMAVTTESTGADQVWAARWPGCAASPAAGIGVAVIDSGVALHRALRGRVVAAMDFTEPREHRARPVRPRHARRGHHRRVAGLRLRRHGAGRADRQPEGARGGRLGQDERRDRGDRLGDRVTARATTSGSSTCRSGIRCSSATARIRCARRSQRAADAGILVVAAAGNFGKTADGGRSSAASCRRATRRRC